MLSGPPSIPRPGVLLPNCLALGLNLTPGWIATDPAQASIVQFTGDSSAITALAVYNRSRILSAQPEFGVENVMARPTHVRDVLRIVRPVAALRNDVVPRQLMPLVTALAFVQHGFISKILWYRSPDLNRDSFRNGGLSAARLHFARPAWCAARDSNSH